MTLPRDPGRLGRRELIARAVVGMPALHPELVTHKPTGAEWKQLARWLAEMWPHDEYTAIITEARRHDQPPGTPG